MVSISGVIFILASLDGRLDLSDNSDLPCSFSQFIQRYNVERVIPHRRAVFVTEPVSTYSSSHFLRIRIFRISSFMLRRYGLRFAYEKKKCSGSLRVSEKGTLSLYKFVCVFSVICIPLIKNRDYRAYFSLSIVRMGCSSALFLRLFPFADHFSNVKGNS